MNTAVHPHTTCRAVDMGGITSEEDAPDPISIDDTLMYAIGTDVDDFVGLRVRKNIVQLKLYALIGRGLLEC